MPQGPVTAGIGARARDLGRLAVALALTAFAADTRAQPARCVAPQIELNFPAGQASGVRDAFARDIRAAIEAVCGWWGASYDGPIRIVVDNYDGPSRALVPAWGGERGYIFFPLGVVYRNRAATLHEVTHVFAPNANRFLAEGLAVHAHDHLQGPPAYPNFGSDLAVEARHVDGVDLTLLDRVATPTPLQTGVLNERANYLVAGAFVRFLIAEYGLDKFRELYAMTPLVPRMRDAGDPARWQIVYGMSLSQLQLHWRATLGADRNR